MTRTLDVFLYDQRVGRLVQDKSGRLSFTYDPAWCATKGAIALSQSLPLRTEAFDAPACRPFFAGLLPEADKRQGVARIFGVSERNDFSLLQAIGGECAGAVTFAAIGSEPHAPVRPRFKRLDDSQLVDLIRVLPDRPLMAGTQDVRLSLAGVQDKVPVLLVDDRPALPLEATPSSHILKPPIRRFADTVHNEALSLRLAKRLGLHVVDVEIRRVHDEVYLLIPRYDRVGEADGTLKRIHQEDFCQALGVVPENKYQNEGGPSLRDCFDLVRRSCSVPAVDVLHLMDAVLFNFLIGNHDAHSKNFSLLYEGEATSLAPLYDILCTAAYPELTDKMAMKIGRKYEPRQVLPGHWEEFAKDAGVAVPATRRRLLELARAIPGAMKLIIAELSDSGFPSPLYANIADLAEHRCATTITNFELKL